MINNVSQKEFYYGILKGILCVVLFNYSLYWLIKNLMNVTNTYVYIVPFNIFLSTSYDFLVEVPTIVVPSLVAIITISFTIIALSFNLREKLPDDIIYKHILYDKMVGGYLAIQSTFVIFLLAILFSNYYNLFWSYVFIFDLGIAVIATFWFFTWFIDRTNKKGIYKKLGTQIDKRFFDEKEDSLKGLDNIPNIQIKDLGNSYLFKFTNFNKKKVPQVNAKSLNQKEIPELLLTTDKEGIHYIHFASRAGIVKIDENKLKKFVTKYKDSSNFNYLIFPKKNNFILGMQGIYEFVFCLEDADEIKELTRMLSDIFTLTESEEIDEINDWLLCLNHSRTKNPKEIEDDFGFLEIILKKAIETNLGLFQLIFNTLERNFDGTLKNNEKVMSQTIFLIYRLRSSFMKNLPLVLYMQSTFKNIILSYSFTLDKTYSKRYATSVLYISEFIRYEFMDTFEQEQNIKKLEIYKQIITNNIDTNHQIVRNTIRSFSKNPIDYEIYLKEHMQQFISTLEIYYEDPYHYNSNYYNMPDTEREIIDKKCGIVKEANGFLRLKITDLAFQMISLIENNKLPFSLKGLVFDFIQYGDIYENTDPAPFWFMDEKLHPSGAYTVPQFPKEKYILIYLFYLKSIEKPYIFPKEEFKNLHLIEELKKTLELFKYEYVTGWIKIERKDFNQIKKELIPKFDEGIKKCNEDEKNKIADAKIEDKLITNFKTSVVKHWKENAFMRRLFEINNNYKKQTKKKPKTNSYASFGYYFIFEKSYFIKNPPVSWGARTVGSSYGLNLARSEDEKILNDIISKKKLLEIEGSIENSLKTLLGNFKDTKHLIIFVNTKQEDKIYNSKFFESRYKMSERDLKEMEKHRSFIGFFEYNATQIPVYQLTKIDVLLIVDIKKIGKLVQYGPYKDIDEELYVEVSELEQKDKKSLSKSEKRETKIKIRIAEKFRVEDIDKSAFEGYTIKNKKTT